MRGERQLTLPGQAGETRAYQSYLAMCKRLGLDFPPSIETWRQNQDKAFGSLPKM